jgi:two-component system response regulator HydG
VIILGESGTGKELAAKAIHDIRGDDARPFVKVNCASLNPSLLESELFGHVKGAFTGAYRSRDGRFAAAGGGDIFLDEIGDIPLSIQVKLLRVLEEKVVERVGDHTPIPINVRIISATNRNLTGMVKQGAFREDLFYRINVIPIHIPPLRERLGDISLLADFFFRRIQLKSGKKIRGISREAMRLLTEYSWPGNVREMKSAFEFAFVSCQEEVILPHHFPPTLFGAGTDLRDPPETAALPLDEAHEKRRRLIEALEAAAGNQSQAARTLGVSRVTVWHWMKKYNVIFERNLKKSE